MIVPGSANALLIRSQSTAYSITNAIRMRAANSATFAITSGATPTDQKKCTISAWLKGTFSTQGAANVALLCTTGNAGLVGWNVGGYAGRLFVRVDGANDVQFNDLSRDPGAWAHYVISVDTTQATAANRVLAWKNGVSLTYNSGTLPTLNSNANINPASTSMSLFRDIVNAIFVDGYIANFTFVDGQALTPSSFGQTSASTGAWVPIRYAGTFGNNGSLLEFKDASAATAAAIGKDTSGRGNNWTPSGISVTAGTTFDQMTDTPTNNVCTFNPLEQGASGLSNANMTVSGAALARGTFAPTSGKWVAEFTMTAAGAGTCDVGMFLPGISSSSTSNRIAYRSDGSKVVDAVVTGGYGSTFTTNDVIRMEVDMAGTVTFFKNNVSQGALSYSAVGYAPYANPAAAWAVAANFGQQSFINTPTTGYFGFNVANISTPSIVNGASYMNATLRTGTGAVASVSSLAFQPDLVWIKSRSNATNNNLFDSSRGVQNYLISNASNAEATNANTLTAFNSNGYSLGTDAGSVGVNINTNTYVDWSWRKGVTPGFDIVLYTGNGANRTIAHSLGAVPHFMIMKKRNSATSADWVTYHRNMDAAPQNGSVYLNLTNAYAANSGLFNNTAPTSSVFSLGTAVNINNNLDTFAAYLWTSIPGFSLFGSYTGNGSADGPFVACGFRPRWIMLKRVDAANDWLIFDTVRNTVNVANTPLAPDLASAESSFGTVDQLVDILSNGFKLRTSTSGAINGAAGSYVFAAFAENSFKYANAR